MNFGPWKHWAVGGVAALSLIAGSAWMADNVSASSLYQAPSTHSEGEAANDSVSPRQLPLGDWHGGQDGYLADALGITTDELDAAQQTAYDKAVEDAKAAAEERLAQAVEDGTLTQEQADAMLERLQGADMPRFGGRFVGAFGLDTYLADALGISQEELQSARQEALKASLAQAVEDGALTQEQADDMLSMKALRDYLSDKLDGVLADSIQQAVDDGVITQDQADRYLERLDSFAGRNHGMLPFFGPGGSMGGYRDGFDHGHGMQPGMHGMRPSMDRHGFNSNGSSYGYPWRGSSGQEFSPDTQQPPAGSSNSDFLSTPSTLL